MECLQKGVIVLASSCLSVLQVQSKDVQRERPNIVIFFADDHASQAISAYGHPVSKIAKTPNIDKIAENGMLFMNSFVENSISTPSRATLLTGLYSHQHGQRRLGCCLDYSKKWFPEYLQENGYKTSVFGKWHLNAEPKGFDYFDILFDQGEYYNPKLRTSDSNGEYIINKGYATDIITDHAIDWLNQIKGADQPFCIMVNHKAPHRNWMPDLKYIQMFEEDTFPEPTTLFDDYSSRGPQMELQELTIDKHLGFAFDFKVEELKGEPTLQYIKDSWDIAMSPMDSMQRKVWDSLYFKMNEPLLANMPQGKDLIKWKYQRYIKDYCRTIKSIDDQVGRVIRYLEDNNLMENTIIIYTSDHGFLLGEHGLYDKRFMYEESLQTPLMISYPKLIQPNKKCKQLVQNIDLMPTILDVANIPVPEDLPGMSLKPLFTGNESVEWRDNIYYQFYDYPAVGSVFPHYGIRTDRYKLIHWVDENEGDKSVVDFWELFDLENDPDEVNNIYNAEKAKPIVAKLKQKLSERRKSIGK